MPTRGGVERVQILPLEADAAAGRLLEPQHELGGRGLAAPGFADDAERPPTLDRERDAIDGAHHAAVAAEEPAPGPEVLAQSGRLEHDHQAAPLRTWLSAASEPAAASQQRTVR